MKHFFQYIAYALVILSCMTSCKKYLETKAIQSLATPSKLSDLEAIMNSDLINKGTSLLNTGADEFYYLTDDWLAESELNQKGYVWDANLDDYSDWNDQYKVVFYANTVLDNLKSISSTSDQNRWNNIKGEALFFRALAFYRIAQLFAPQFDSATADKQLGIVLRLNADFNEVSERASVRKTYDQIIGDLKESLLLLTDNLPSLAFYKTVPTKAAVYGFLARVYLQISDYQNAKLNADACLKLYSTLLDYNTLQDADPTSDAPFKKLNPEVIFYSNNDGSAASNSTAKIDSSLYASFDSTDIRKTAFFIDNFDGTFNFKGSYNEGSVDLFCGIATDEIYLIRAECFAREGNLNSAMLDLNKLLSKRKAAPFTPLIASSSSEALNIILKERKKELIFREVRWSDLKRLNKQPTFSVKLHRKLDAQNFELPPNDLRYSLLIPLETINIAKLPQNPR